MVQQGGSKALIPMALQGTDKGTRCAAQALARIGITQVGVCFIVVIYLIVLHGCGSALHGCGSATLILYLTRSRIWITVYCTYM